MALNEKRILESINSRFVVTLGYAYEDSMIMYKPLYENFFGFHNQKFCLVHNSADFIQTSSICGLAI